MDESTESDSSLESTLEDRKKNKGASSESRGKSSSQSKFEPGESGSESSRQRRSKSSSQSKFKPGESGSESSRQGKSKSSSQSKFKLRESGSESSRQGRSKSSSQSKFKPRESGSESSRQRRSKSSSQNTTRENGELTYQGSKINMRQAFSTQVRNARRQFNGTCERLIQRGIRFQTATQPPYASHSTEKSTPIKTRRERTTF
ncbi:Hypothetical protein SMAX5B_016615 [Scophthalmus maximus]|uniref:Uncharacterized protein n=1 Tax=Scophthalmus maximus TaxID=52904 RepID=A0A2U9BZL7_SCOMX|nr:Hypothetical protein SMAX5B_016615 [Scophthalmus maximus]